MGSTLRKSKNSRNSQNLENIMLKMARKVIFGLGRGRASKMAKTLEISCSKWQERGNRERCKIFLKNESNFSSKVGLRPARCPRTNISCVFLAIFEAFPNFSALLPRLLAHDDRRNELGRGACNSAVANLSLSQSFYWARYTARMFPIHPSAAAHATLAL